ASLLEDWNWLIGRKLPILIAAAGDAFVQDPDDGSVHLLDVAAGRLSLVARDIEEFQSLLADRDFVMSHPTVEMVVALRERGMTLGPGHIYSYKKSPVLGGEIALDNVEMTDIAVHFSIAGQIHEQVSKL